MTNRLLIVMALTSLMLAPVAAKAQYQLSNPGFESWEGTSATSRPSHWSSFPQADGSWAWAASTAQHYHRHGGRPGTAGSSYLTIYSRSVLGIVANGNMTTGQIHVGSTSASNSSNYNYTHRGGSYCHAFSGTPDSMYVWVSYYAASASSQGSIRAYLHGNNDFRDPNDCSSTNLFRGRAVAEFGRTTTSSSSPTWVQQKVRFEYNGASSVNYVLMSMTTNTTPGGGSANDSLSVDDIEFVYSAWLDSLLVNGTAVADFRRDSFDYVCQLSDYLALQSATISYVAQAADATVTVDTIQPDELTRQFVFHVVAEDSITSRLYTITLTCPPLPCDTVDGIMQRVEGNNVAISWSAGANNRYWEVEYGLHGFTLGTGAGSICEAPAILLQDLEYNCDYDLYIRALCGDNVYSEWSQTVSFTTGDLPAADCLPVDSIVVNDIDFTECSIALFSSSDTDVYQLVLLHNADTVVDTVVHQQNVEFVNLQEGSTYLLYVRTLCDSLRQSSWTLATFSTLADTMTISSLQTENVAYTLYPNPAHDKVNCVLDAFPSCEGVVIFFDATGREVMSRRFSANNHSIDVSMLSAGCYLVVLRAVDGTTAVQRLSIVR